MKKILLITCLLPLLVIAQDRDVFLNPPIKYGPYVWWHWAGPNFSKEGITKDLEAMKATGIGGATIFNITSAVQESHVPTGNNPWPENTYRSKAYWNAVKHAASEALRLGLDIGLHNTVGYSTTGGPWVNEENGMQCLVSTQTVVDGGKNIELKLAKGEPPVYGGWGTFRVKTKSYHDISVLAVPENVVNESDIVEVTSFMDEEGILRWNAPKGKWKIFRFGYAPTGANPHPVPDDLMGKVFEVDKMNRENNIFHWEQVLKPLKKEIGCYLGKSFRHVLIDSYEAGNQTWTNGFEKEFKKLKKYDPLPWLTGCIGSEEERKRFDYDYKDVISRMFYTNGFKVGRDIAHKYGLDLMFEPYGGPFNTISCTCLADVPMGEFWTHGTGYINGYVVSSARADGKKIIGAEAFTSLPENSAWTEDPASLKFSADGAYCSGVNRLILHHWVHQPFDDKYQPGLSMGWWGTHFSRHQTWFEPGKAFFAYMSRIQYMLQQGEEDVDYLCLDKLVGKCDVISSSDLLDMDIKVKNGKIVLPSGRKYSFMVCPQIETVELPVLMRLIELSKRKAVIVGPSPLRSPSLSGYPECDSIVREMGRRLSLCHSIEDAKKVTGFRKSFNSSVSWDKVNIVSKTTDSGKILFMANRTNEEQKFVLDVDILGKQPEIWDPETGKVENARFWHYNKDRYTSVDVELHANQTLFLVFKSIPDSTVSIVQRNESVKPVKSMSIRGGWNVEFLPKIGDKFSMHFDQLSDFKYSTDKRVMYFSGKAVYRKSFELNEDDLQVDKMILSLGEMNDIARVFINGKDAGVWWYPPYKKEISSFLRCGTNELTVEVTVNWANCLIGDEQKAPDFEFGTDRGKRGKALKAYPDWFIKNKERPSERKTFTIWYYYNIDSPLQSAGLVGPVEIIGYN